MENPQNKLYIRKMPVLNYQSVLLVCVVISVTFGLSTALLSIVSPIDAYASNGSSDDDEETAQKDGVNVNEWEQSCYNGGFRDGQGEPFENEAYKECGDYGDGADRYYDGFIDGCMSVSGNTKDVCESSTDA